jgi:hypothetical protein
MQYQQVAVIGGKGPGPGQFRDSLRGIALDPPVTSMRPTTPRSPFSTQPAV